MKEKNTAKRLFSVLWIYFLCAALTAILIPLPQKESSGELWRQHEARLDTPAAQERVMTIEDSDSALLLRLQLIESARRELIFSTFDLRADESGQDVMSALCAAAERGVQVRMIVDGLNGFLHLQGDATLRALAAAENVEVRFYDPVDLLRPWKLNYRLHDKYLIADGERYILGGRNTSDLFLGSYQEKRNIDRDVLGRVEWERKQLRPSACGIF
ncbi:MAG: phospholipase D-like domain-containing protein [Oscillospiraceae bacterium]|nr:phospholipase D-like domain-containing protein [Oscillospiraceae bacterium]